MEFGRIWAEINLDALNKNLNQVRRHADNGKVMLAIKADAYGHGLREVAQEVADRVDIFGVASTDEGITLRLGGIKNAILVLSPVPYREIPTLFEHNLTPSVTETEFAQRLSREAVKRGASIGLHVEVDTGMGRTGVDESTAGDFVAGVAKLPGLDLEGVFTHFPAADS